MFCIVPQHFKDLLCPKCKQPTVYMDLNIGHVMKPVPITQKQPYCSNCGFTAETEFGFINAEKMEKAG